MLRFPAAAGLTVLAAVALAALTGRAADAGREPAGPPGFRVVVRSDFLTRDLAVFFRRSFPVNEDAKEGSLSSLVNTAGWAYVETEPCADRVAVQFIVRGVLRATSVRSRGKVHAFTREAASFWIVQELFLDAKGISLGGLAVSLPIHSELLEIKTDFKGPADDFIQGFGETRFDIGLKHDDRKISRAAEDRMREDITKEATRRLKDTNKDYKEQLLDELERNGMRLDDLRFSSDEGAIRVSARLRDQELPAAPALPDSLVALQLHQDTFNRVARRSMGGKTYTDQEMERNYLDLARQFNLPPLPKSEEKPMTVKMARQPMVLKVDRGVIELTIQGESYVVGDNQYPGMNVTVRYRIVRKDGELRLVRDEELEVLPPDFKPGTPLGARQQVLRTVLRHRFGRLFPREVPFRGMDLPESLPLTGTFRVEVLRAEDGWLTAGVGFRRGAGK
jgi:hypothetical protein